MLTPNGAMVVDLNARLRWIIEQVLEEQHWTATELADKMGVSQQNMSRILCVGGGTTLSFVARLCAVLGEDVEVLFARHPQSRVHGLRRRTRTTS